MLKKGLSAPLDPKTQVGWGDVQLQDDSSRLLPELGRQRLTFL